MDSDNRCRLGYDWLGIGDSAPGLEFAGYGGHGPGLLLGDLELGRMRDLLFHFSRQTMQPDVDGLHPEMSKITLLCEFEQIPLIVAYVLLLQCAWLDLSGLLFQSGLSSALATRSVKKSLYLRPVWYAFIWIILGLFVVR